jgi:molecular chaperone DnaK (HSP70)
MDDEWEDYQWELQQYDKQRARAGYDGDDDPTQNTSRTIAIDLGTVYTKLAKSHPKPEVLISREGDRAFFNGILYPENSASNTNAAQRGRAALERFYFETEDQEDDTNKVRLPWRMLLEAGIDTSSSTATDDAAKTVSDVLTPALTEALDRLDYSQSQQLRTTITVPVQLTHSDVYATAFSKTNMLPNLSHTTVLLPDPVAAVWGAQHHNLLPTDQDAHHARTFLVMDVGGYVTQLSIVQKDVVQNHLTLQWGGETPIELLVGLLTKESPSPLSDARSLSALQTQARMAVAELAGKSRVKVHVPYLFADPSNHHLDTTVSRPVLEQEIQADIHNRLVSSIIADQVDHASDGLLVLSPHMPSPTDLQSLWTSAVTQLLEISQQTPMSLDNILLVGGGFKSPATVESARAALYTLMGPEAVRKTVVPDSSLLSELTALGAASMLPGYEYSMDSGLHRM